VRCPFGCVVVDDSRRRHLASCAAANAARANINEDTVAVAVDGSCVVGIGSKRHGVALEVAFVQGRMHNINAVCVFPDVVGDVPCVLRVVDTCLDESIRVVISEEGHVHFTTILTNSIATHSAVRWLSATWT
jgi:hypothetical protein